MTDPLEKLKNSSNTKDTIKDPLETLKTSATNEYIKPILDYRETSKYDEGYLPNLSGDLEKYRGEKQSWGSEALNAIGGGIAKIPFSIIGNTASILDFEDYYNTDNEIGNSVTAWTEEVKGDIEGATKIYKSNDNTLGSREWWMNNAKGLIDSAGGFIVTGGALGGGVKLLSTLAKSSKVINAIQGVGAVSNAVMLNQAESIPIAMNVYNDAYQISLKKNQLNADKTGLTPEMIEFNARQDAADAAAYSVNINRINIPLNLTSAFAFIRPADITRQVAKDFSKKEILTNLLKEGSQEYLEENINMLAEKEAIRKAEQGNQYSYDFNKTASDVISKEGFETGLVGFIGGAIQTAGTDLLKSRQKDAPSYDEDGNVKTDEFGQPIFTNRIQSQKERFKAQQKSLNNIELLSKSQGLPSVRETLDRVKITSEILNDIQIASIANDELKVDELKNKLLSVQALDAFKNGTTEQLINTYKSIQRDPSTKEKLGEGYMTKASEAIKEIENLEKIYIQYQNLPQVNEIFNNRADYTYNLKEASKLKAAEAQAKVEQLREIEITGYNTPDKINSLQTTKELIKIQEKLDKIKNNVINLNEDLNKITTEKYTAKTVKKQEASKQAKEELIDQQFEETYSETNYGDLINKATSERELNKILDQADEEGLTNPELLDLINKKRESFKPIDNNKFKLNNTPVVEETQEIVEVDNQLYPNTRTITSGGKIVPNTEREKISELTKGELMSSKEVQDLITSKGNLINDEITIDAVEYNGSKSIRFKIGDKVLGYAQTKDGKYSNEIQQLLDGIKTGDILSNEQVKKLGLYINVSNGFIKLTDNAIKLSDLDSIAKTNGDYVIFDQGSNKYRQDGGDAILIRDAKGAVQVGEITIPNGQKSLSRYLLSFFDKTVGKWKFAPITPSKLENVNKYLNSLISLANRIKKGDKEGAYTSDQIKEFNDEINKNVFIAVDKSELEGRNIEVDFNIDDKGDLRVNIVQVFYADNKATDKVLYPLTVKNSELASFENSEALLNHINSLTKFNSGISITPDSFRNSIPKEELTQKDVSGLFETYVAPEVLEGQDVVISINKPVVDLNTIQEDVTSKPAVEEIKSEEPAKVETKEEERARKKAERKSTQLNKPDDEAPAFKLSDKQVDDLITQVEISEVERIVPEEISVETKNDIREFLNNVNGAKATWGYFKGSLISLWTGAQSGTGYHEAFHAIFRTAINNKDVDRYLRLAEIELKGKYNKQELSNKLAELRSSSLNYQDLSDEQLYDLMLEEYLADKFMDWKKNKDTKVLTGIKKLFNRLNNAIKELFRMTDTLDAFFTKIDEGAFSSTKAVPNKQAFVTEKAFKNLITGEKTSMSSTKSKKIINTFAARVVQLAKTKDNKLSNDELIDKLIDERINTLETKGYDYIDSLNDGVQKTKLETSLEEELFTLENDGARKLLFEQVKKRLEIFENKPDESIDEEGENNDKGGEEGFGSKESWTLSLEESTNKVIREYIAFAMYKTIDELTGEEVDVAVDAQTIYNGLGHVLANTEEDKMMDKFITYAKDNEQAKAVLDMIMSDTGMTYDEQGLISNPKKNFNDLRKIITAFKNVKITFLHTGFIPKYNKGILESSSVRVGNANVNTPERISISNWANNLFQIKRNNQVSEEFWTKRFNNALNTFKKDAYKPLSEKDLLEQIKEVQKAFSQIGLDLSSGYLRFSILSYKNKIAPETLSDEQKHDLGVFADAYKPLDLQTIKGEPSGYSLYEYLVKDKDAFEEGEEGMGGRMKEIAKNNGLFDESLATSNFKGADGNTRYDLIKSSYVLDETLRLRSESYRNFLKEKYEILKDNLLFRNNKFLNNLTIDLISGVRDESYSDNEGKVFGDFSEREYWMQNLGYWFAQKNNKAYTLFRQNEASNTAYVASMHIANYITSDGTVDDNAVNHVYSFFKAEYNRIARESAKGLGNIKGYNDKTTGRAFRFTEFANLAYTIGGAKYNELSENAKVNSPITEELEKDVKNTIKKNLTSQIKEFKKELAKNNLISFDGSKVTQNLLLPTKLNNKTLDLKEFENTLSDLYLNDYINSFSLNQLFDGDYALSRDDKGVKEVEIDGVNVMLPKQELSIDIVKRNKGAMGSGSDLGKGDHRVAFIKDINVFVDGKKDGQLIRSDKGDKINSNDAQSYTNINHIIFMAERLGRVSEDVKSILRKIRRGIPITSKEQVTLEDSQTSLNPWKTVTFGREFYIKTSEAVISRHEVSYITDMKAYNDLIDELEFIEDTKELTKEALIEFNKELIQLYKPIPGKEYYHKMLNQMDIHGIDQIVAESASKGMTLSPVDSLIADLDLSTAMIDIPNSYKRLQVETPTGKNVITAGTQLMQLIDSEQRDEEIVNFQGKNITVGDLRKQYREAMSKTRDNSFKLAEQYIKYDADGNIDTSKLRVKFLKALESSGADEQLLEIFKLNWNLLPAIDKAEQLFLSHFGGGVLAQKVPGTKVAMMSDAHWNLVVDENNKVILNKEVKIYPTKYEKFAKRKLLHNVRDKKTGKLYSECVLSERVFSKFGLNIGDEIPVEIATMLGYRIPTQDKHSMVALRVVDVLPNYLEGTGIFPAELVLLSGADFDIDSLFIQQPSFWIKEGKAIKAGTETTLQDKWDSFLNYIRKEKLFEIELNNIYSTNELLLSYKAIPKSERTQEDKDGYDYNKRRIFKRLLHSWKLPSTIEEFEQALKDGKTLNNNELNNKILDSEIDLLINKGIEDIALTPVTSDPLVVEANYIQSLKENNNQQSNSSSSLLGKAKAFFQNSAGKAGIGPVANALQAFTFLAKNNIRRNSETPLIIDGVELSKFDYINQEGGRVADTLSTILSVMTDNAKDPIAGKMGLSLEILTAYNYLISLGIPLRTASLIINTPSVQMYAKLLKENKYSLKTESERKGKKTDKINDLIKELTQKAGLPPIVNLSSVEAKPIDTSTLEQVIRESEITTENGELNLDVLITFLQIEKEAKAFGDLNNIIKLTKGLPTSFTDVNKGMIESIYNLGLDGLFELPTKGDKEVNPIIDIKEAVKNDDLLFRNITNALQVLNYAKGIFISETQPFMEEFNTLLLNLKDGLSKDSIKELKRSFLGFISTKAYIKYMQSREFSPIADFNPTKDELIFPALGGETLGKQLVKFKSSDNEAIRNNSFIKWLKADLNTVVDENSKITIDKVSGKSFIKLSTESINDIVNSFQDLYLNPETNQFAINSFHYLLSKDNLEYRNDSFVKYIAPFMFNSISNGLTQQLKELVAFGNSEEFKANSKEFRELNASYIPSQGNLKRIELQGEYKDSYSFDFSSSEGLFDSDKINGQIKFKYPEYIIVKIGKITQLYYNDLKGQQEDWDTTAVYKKVPSFGFKTVSVLGKSYNDNINTYTTLEQIKKSEVKKEDKKGSDIQLTPAEQSAIVEQTNIFDNIPKQNTSNNLEVSEKNTILFKEVPKGLTEEDITNLPDC